MRSPRARTTMRRTGVGITAVILLMAATWPAQSEAQSRVPPLDPEHTPLYAGIAPTDTRWELTLDTRLGYPEGYVRVGEAGTAAKHLRLHEDLGIKVSEALEASAAFHFTPRDAVRLTGLYYFLDGSAWFAQPFGYNGGTFGPGKVHTNADFYRLSLAYERLLMRGYGGILTGIAGISYVHLDPELTGQGHSNAEDFYRQELPVPIVGFRADIPMNERFGARALVTAGGLPRVDSLRKEGGTVYLSQFHVDGGLALTYAVSRSILLEAGYNYTFLMQHEKSHEDDNAFELNDNGFRFGLKIAF